MAASDPPHNPCATCGACCRSYIVPVCGYDVWLISRRERLSPEDFLMACRQQQPGLDGFHLQHAGPGYGLALDKNGPFQIKQPCVFLVRLNDGHERCGIYDHRPVVCQGYPMAMWSGQVFQRSESLCPPGAWPLPAVLRPSWRTAIQRFYMYMDVYIAVVARWNAWVAAHPAVEFPLPSYFNYLLNVYDRLDQLNTEVGDAALETIRAAWPTVPRPEEDLLTAYGRPEEVPWLDYFLRAQAIIAGFYPQIPAAAQVRLAQTF
ncbi:MAG TPA: YkgJ family cysteine cluster protein [Chloroflexia bacterium]|nr:YkgJ family cysteine cluster protein [Chloroflexia bacterium]